MDFVDEIEEIMTKGLKMAGCQGGMGTGGMGEDRDQRSETGEQRLQGRTKKQGARSERQKTKKRGKLGVSAVLSHFEIRYSLFNIRYSEDVSMSIKS